MDDLASASALVVLAGTRRVLVAEGLSDALRQMALTAREALGFEAVAIYSPDPRAALLRLSLCLPAATGFPSALPLDDTCLLSQTLMRRLPACCLHLRELTAAQEEPEAPVLCVTLLAAQEAPLGIVLARPPADSPTSPQAWLEGLQALAGCVELAVERAEFQRVRDRMVSSVSHELRTPLTSVRAFSEMLLDGDAGRINARQRRYLEHIAEGADRLERLTAGLLRLSRLRLGPDALELQDMLVKPFVQDVALTQAIKAKEKQIALIVDVPDDLPSLLTDPQWLQQALGNFVDNAIKYSPPGTRIVLSAALNDGHVVFEVSDEGPGIEPDEQALVFDEFYRCPARTQEGGESGSGLGLTIVRRLAELLGARIILRSTPGQGSTFGLTVPLQAPANREPQASTLAEARSDNTTRTG
jgi:signal transduction histidine kinase